jgi:hypothetical protein
MMTVARLRDGEARRSTERMPGPAVTFVLLAVVVLLLAFAIGAGLLHQTALELMAGTAGVTLAGEIVRRYLAYNVGPAKTDGTVEPSEDAPE